VRPLRVENCLLRRILKKGGKTAKRRRGKGSGYQKGGIQERRKLCPDLPITPSSSEKKKALENVLIRRGKKSDRKDFTVKQMEN